MSSERGLAVHIWAQGMEWLLCVLACLHAYIFCFCREVIARHWRWSGLLVVGLFFTLDT